MSVCLGELPDVPFGEAGAGDGLRVLLLTQRETLEKEKAELYAQLQALVV